MEYKQLEGILERFVHDETNPRDKKCKLILFGVYFAKAIEELQKGNSKTYSKLAAKIKEKESRCGMTTELRHAVEHLSKDVTLNCQVIEAIKAAKSDTGGD